VLVRLNVFHIQVFERYSNYELEREARLHIQTNKQSTPTFFSAISPIKFHAKTCQTYTYANYGTDFQLTVLISLGELKRQTLYHSITYKF
jgi:hypothetical protein